jgi:hypothetical protein
VKTKKDLSPIDREGKTKNEEIVDILLPPREWIETGKLPKLRYTIIDRQELYRIR